MIDPDMETLQRLAKGQKVPRHGNKEDALIDKAVSAAPPRHGNKEDWADEEADVAERYGARVTEDLLNERGKTHGDYRDHARYTQRIKLVVVSALDEQQKMLTASQAEALDMIAHKIGRILAGDADHQDHWDDIAGYATLVSNELDE